MPGFPFQSAIEILPGDLGYVAWTCDPIATRDSAATGITAGTLYVSRLFRVPPGTITGVELEVITGGGTLTAARNFVALYNAATLAQVGVSADQATPWASAGVKTTAWTSPVAWTGGDLYVGLFWNGTTAPSFRRGLSAGNAVNGRRAAGAGRFATSSTALTTAAPNPAGALTNSSAQPLWVALY